MPHISDHVEVNFSSLLFQLNSQTLISFFFHLVSTHLPVALFQILKENFAKDSNEAESSGPILFLIL